MGIKRLIVLPESPGEKSGYQKAVAADIVRLKPTQNDLVIYYTQQISSELKNGSTRIITRPKLFSFNRLLNILSLRVSSELRAGQLKKEIKQFAFDEIICGDVTLYRAIKELFPQQKITVRFHNFFTLTLIRHFFLETPIHWMHLFQLRLLRKLEKKILTDAAVIPLFITAEEHSLFKLLYPNRQGYLWEAVTPGSLLTEHAFQIPDRPLLVWFGGVSHHKKYSLLYFIKHVYYPLQRSYPTVELHLFGKGTEVFTNKNLNILGHGYWKSSEFPFNGKALFINPDLLGGGIKLKINDWLTNQVSFISTPFGIEGYTLAASEYIIIEPMENWKEAILSFFNKHSLL